MANTVFNLAWINALLNKSDSSKRFFPLANSGGLRNFITDRPDPIMQEFSAGGKVFIRDSVRNNKFFVIGSAGSTKNNEIINGFRCQAYGVYIVDRQNNIIGSLSSTTGNCGTCDCNSSYSNTGLACSPLMADPYNLIFVPLYANDGTRNGIALTDDVDSPMLYPIPVDQESIYAKLIFNNAKDTVQGNEVNFDFAADFKDSTLQMIPCSSFTDWVPSMIRGLIDVCPVFTEVDQTTFTVQLETNTGTAVQKTLAQGWVIGDFTLYNVTDSAPVTILTVTESATTSGEYVFTYASQTLGDELLLSATKTGFDTTCFAKYPTVVPAS